jgi:hypothetical protein
MTARAPDDTAAAVAAFERLRRAALSIYRHSTGPQSRPTSRYFTTWPKGSTGF